MFGENCDIVIPLALAMDSFDCGDIMSHAFHSPVRKSAFVNPPSSTDHHNSLAITPHQPQPPSTSPNPNHKRPRSESSSEPSSEISQSQYEPPAQRPRTNLNAAFDAVSNSEPFGHMADALKRVGTAMSSDPLKLLSDPLLGCLLSLQTGIMACTADLISRRTATDEDCFRLKKELEDEKKEKYEMKLQILKLKEKLENPDKLNELFLKTSAYKQLEEELKLIKGNQPKKNLLGGSNLKFLK